MRTNGCFYPRRGRYLAITALFIALAITQTFSALAVTITGDVTNGTTNRPAAGDPVVLIALQQRMQEIAHAKTDAKGHFSIDAPDPGMHLIRVDHQGAGYFTPAPPNTPNVTLTVYDVAPEVTGVTTEANVMRVETDQQGLKVIQNIFVKNDSKPPRTQFSNRSYEIYLPPDARIEGSAARGPGGMPVQASPMPLSEKGHYAFPFPLRPGETQFQLSYHLPYSGSLAFTPHLANPADNFVVMLPKSMTFKAGNGASFQQLNEDPNTQTFLARNVTPSQPVGFTLSGSGAMPRETQTEQGQAEAPGAQGAGGAASPSSDNRPGIGLGTPIDTPDPLNKYKWWILGGLAVSFAVAAGFLLRKPAGPATSSPIPAAAPASIGSLMDAIKEELFVIETERVQGKISDSEYGELKSALELVLRRALSRQAA